MQSRMVEILQQIICLGPIETMIKSINQAINLSIQRAGTIVSVSVGADDDEYKVVCVVGLILLLSNISTIDPCYQDNNPSNS